MDLPTTEARDFDLQDPLEAACWLCTPGAIRQRCEAIYRLAEGGVLEHFTVVPARLDDTARYVVTTIRENYRNLVIPYHSRWRHFAVDGRDRWMALASRLEDTPQEIARIRTELVIVSVLLDAGAGPEWRYREPGSNRLYRRSEGLALASFHAYRLGIFSILGDAEPLRVDGEVLCELTPAILGRAFQVSEDNPLVGLEGRVGVLRRLGETLLKRHDVFGATYRLGRLHDHLAGQARARRLQASTLLITVLDALGAIWPGRIELGGINLGDVWRHPLLRCDDASSELVPFHKLSQWLSYSLVEPLEAAGIRVTNLDQLTGLPEYRNGGLLLDMGLIRPRQPGMLDETYRVDSPEVVEWRALTVALLDRLAVRVRELLGMDAARLPLASILEGGTWSAGRRIARALREDGAPPIRLISDGTVF